MAAPTKELDRMEIEAFARMKKRAVDAESLNSRYREALEYVAIPALERAYGLISDPARPTITLYDRTQVSEAVADLREALAPDAGTETTSD